MTMITKRRAAVSAGAVPSMGVFGPKRAGDRLAVSKLARLDGPSRTRRNPMTGAAIPANSSDVQSKGWSRISRRQLKHATFVIAAVSGVVTAADRGEMKVALR
jgi:hypothetical protein